MDMVQYYSNYIQDLASRARPLYALTKSGIQLVRGVSDSICGHQAALDFSAGTTQARPELPYILQTGWSCTAVGAVLGQEGTDGEEHPVAFASRILKGPETRHSATEGECFAVVTCVELFPPYLQGLPFTLETDHWALKWLMSGPQQNSKLAR